MHPKTVGASVALQRGQIASIHKVRAYTHTPLSRLNLEVQLLSKTRNQASAINQISSEILVIDENSKFCQTRSSIFEGNSTERII